MADEIKITNSPIPPNPSSIRRDIRTRYSEATFINQENNRLHNPYEDEQRRLEAISQGDMETMETFWTYNYGDAYGQLAKNQLRNIKNLCIGNIILSSRAAIKGGVSPEIAFSYVDVYIQKLEEYDKAESIVELTHSADVHFTEMVIDVQKRITDESLYITVHIEDCKKYIFAHLHEKLTVQDIAEDLHLNSNYLSTIFRKCEGMTILQYIIREKIKIAKNMLTFSGYSYSAIANYLGFSGQSHMGTHFKKLTGMTMHEYRTLYRNPCFIDPSDE